MATFTASAAQSTSPAIMHLDGAITRVVEYTQVASLSAGDVIQMVRVPQGAIVTSVLLASSMSAGATTVVVGDGNNISAYAVAVVLSAAPVFIDRLPYNAFGRSYSAEDTIDINVTVVSATPASAKLKLIVTYTMQNGDAGG